MAYPSQQTGLDPQSKILVYITKQLDRILGLVGKSSSVVSDGTQKTQIVDSNGDNILTGIAKGEYVATPSNTVDLVHPGWLEAMSDGTVKYTTFYGEDITRTVGTGWVSLGVASRVWLTGTSATINVHYE